MTISTAPWRCSTPRRFRNSSGTRSPGSTPSASFPPRRHASGHSLEQELKPRLERRLAFQASEGVEQVMQVRTLASVDAAQARYQERVVVARKLVAAVLGGRCPDGL